MFYVILAFIVTSFIDLIFDSFVTDANIWMESDPSLFAGEFQRKMEN